MIRNETIWITGASSGIGYATAKTLAVAGNRVIASGRNRQALDKLVAESDNIIPMICDLVIDSQDQIGESLALLTSRLDRIVLSAGDCLYLDVNNSDWSCTRSVMDINYHGSVRAIQAALPLLEIGRAHV